MKTQVLIDKETGKKIKAEYLNEKEHFLFTLYSCGVLEKIAGKKLKILQYILENKNSSNYLLITTKELALKTKTSHQTVILTLKILKECGAITTRTGAIIVSKLAVLHKENGVKSLCFITE